METPNRCLWALSLSAPSRGPSLVPSSHLGELPGLFCRSVSLSFSPTHCCLTMGSWTNPQAASVSPSLHCVLFLCPSPWRDPVTTSAGRTRSLSSLGKPPPAHGLACSALWGRGRGARRPGTRRECTPCSSSHRLAQGQFLRNSCSWQPPPGSSRLPGELSWNQREMGQIIATLNKAKLVLPARPSTRDFLSLSGRQQEAPDMFQFPAPPPTPR